MSILLNPSGMPKGTGSLSMRGRVWWMLYTDAAGRNIQVNTRTPDKTEARRQLAREYLVVWREIARELEHIADAGQSESSQGYGADRPGSRAALPRGARHTDTNRRKAKKETIQK